MGAAVAGGVLIALFYDIYWLLLAYKYRPGWLRALQDLLFWLIVFCALAALWLYATGGVMRLAIYLWLALGAALTQTALKRPVRRLRQRPKSPAATPRLPSAATLAFKQRLLSMPAAAMLGLGLGFWQVWAWFSARARQGRRFFAAHLFKRNKE